jgi:hypothetical protein
MNPGEAVRQRHWREVRATILAQHRTLRIVIDSARGVSQALVDGDELGIVSLPYIIVALDRALLGHVTLEEQLVLPLLEADPWCGPGAAEFLRTSHTQVRREMAALRTAGAQQAITVAHRLRALSAVLCTAMAEEEQTLWADHPWPESPPACVPSA